MQFKSFVAAILTATAMLAGSFAQASADTDKIGVRVFSKYGVKPDSVAETPIKGLYEVVVQRRIYYIDEQAKYLINGNMFEMESETNLTEKRMEEVSRIKWETLPLQDAFKTVYGKGERKVVVFSDANCTYCQVLERSLRQVGNVTVYTFIYPILNSRDVGRKIVCAADPDKAWQQHMADGTVPPAAPQSCDSSLLDRNYMLGQSLGLNSTPSIIFADGTLYQGAMNPGMLDRALDSTAAK